MSLESPADDVAPLAARLPPLDAPVDADDLLDRFLGYVAAKGIELYPAQEEALLELMAGRNIILNTPTGSGKSLVALAMHFKAMAEGRRSFYTSPIKALASEKFFQLCEAFGPDHVGMITGDASINRDAPIVCCTAEILANIALRDGDTARVDYAVLDEFHYYADRDRGVAWEVPLLTLRNTTFLLMSATLGNTEFFEKKLGELTGRPVALIRSEQRPVPLDYDYRETPLHETVEHLVTTGRYPVYIVNFTQRACADEAQNLMSTNFCSKEEKQAIAEALRDVRFDTPYGKEVSRFVRHGIGLHHAGLLPRYRLLVEKLAQKSLLKVICGTDTLGVGVNVPIRTVLFTRLCKYDGEKTGILSVRDFRQISGRAGRKGFDDEGSVVVQAPEHLIENQRMAAKEAAGGKKQVRRKPPEKNYVPWDRGTFDQLLKRRPEDLVSRFTVTHGMLLNVLQGDALDPQPRGGYGRLIGLIDTSHADTKTRRTLRRSAKLLFRSLLDASIVKLVPRNGGYGQRVALGEGIDQDFSLHHALSLYLVETLGRLDPDAGTYPLDVLSLCEAILENPDVVLVKQLDRIKTEKLFELKAQGVEYEERMAELEKLEYPKPLREFVYDTFNDFAKRHPWVAEESIRPKSVAREMYETYCSFDEYVREYGLERSEGLLLRYLSDAYKAVVQNVPKEFKSDDVLEMIAYLRGVVRGVDSSLLDEWEGLTAAGVAPSTRARGEAEPTDAERRADEKKALVAQLRSEALRVMRAIAVKDWDGAARSVDATVDEPWTAERIERTMAPYFDEYRSVRLDNESRSAKYTRVEQWDDRIWRVTQTLVDPEGDNLWAIELEADLDRVRDPSAPLVVLRALGPGIA